MAREIATFAGGCFWGVEADFRKIEGVLETSVGYMGGHVAEPTYEQVCAKNTGHAEVARITFDPDKVSYDQLLDAFWAMHDPTQVNRQGPDIGDQYRSAIFYHSPEQEAAARASMQKLAASGELDQPIATEIVPATDYWLAEDYHQQYFEKKGMAACPAHLAQA